MTEDELFLTQSSFNGSTNRGNELENFVTIGKRTMKTVSLTLRRRQKDCSALTTRTSISSVEKEDKANKKKSSKRDIIVVDSKDLLARNRDRTQKHAKKVNFWCFNVWNEGAAKQIALPHNTDDFFSQVRNNGLATLENFKSPDYKLFQDAIDSEMKRLTLLERVSA